MTAKCASFRFVLQVHNMRPTCLTHDRPTADSLPSTVSHMHAAQQNTVDAAEHGGTAKDVAASNDVAADADVAFANKRHRVNARNGVVVAF